MRRASSRGMTLLEIIVAISILAMVALLIFGAFDGLNKGKKGEALRSERARQGRSAVLRMARELQSAFLSLHQPLNMALNTRVTVFSAQPSGTFDRVDFAAFAHRRLEKDAKESDQAEIGYFVVADPNKSDKFDLVRREQTPIDLEPTRGGVVNVLAEDVEELHFKYLDPMNSQWTDRWDTTQVSGQPGRLPLFVRITLKMKKVPGANEYEFTTKAQIPIQAPLMFGIPR
jgi:general secretion pathway protein J